MTFSCDLLRLSSSEHLLLWCLRTVVQRGEDAEIHEGIVGAFEGEGEETARTLYRFLFLLGFGARRPILMESPGCLRVTADERRLLSILALAQPRPQVPVGLRHHGEAGTVPEDASEKDAPESLCEDISETSQAALAAHLRWLVRGPAMAPAAAAAQALARAMLAQDHRLPLPALQRPAPPWAGGGTRLRLVASSPAALPTPHPEPLTRSAMPWPETAR